MMLTFVDCTTEQNQIRTYDDDWIGRELNGPWKKIIACKTELKQL